MRWPVLIAFILLALSGYGRSMPMLIQQSATGATLVGADLNDPNVVPPPTGVTCTTGIGPFTSATTMTTISNTINALDPAGGQIVCLQRGQTWTSGTLSLTESFPNGNRVTICASTGSSCTDSGAANPKLSLTGTCGSFSAAAGGYTIKNLDCLNTNNANSNVAWSIPYGAANIGFEGGVVDTYWFPFYLETPSGGNPIPTNLSIGTCANRVEVRGTPTAGPTSSRALSYGPSSNSTWRLWVHDWTGNANNSQNHMLDFTRGTAGSHLNPTDGSVNLTVECSTFDYTGQNGQMGNMIKIALGANVVIRDTTFTVGSGSCPQGSYIAAGSHNSNNETEGWDGGAIYRNRFDTRECKGPITINAGRNIDIYNNVANLSAADDQRGFVEFSYARANLDPGLDDLLISGIAIFDNTIYRPGNSSEVGSGFAVITEEMNPPPDRPAGTGLSLRNNIVYITDSVDAKVMNQSYSGCSGWGTNGANIKNNFVYSPNDASPSLLWTSCSGDTGNSTTFNTSPALVNVGAGNFHAATSASPPCNFGTTPQPVDDFDLVTRSTPPDVGAYECP